MRLVKPYIEVPGDNRVNIMARSGDCLGLNFYFSVWRFGFMPLSEAAQAYGVSIDNPSEGFLWVLATRKIGTVKDTFRGYAIELPDKFRRVIDGEFVAPKARNY